MLLILGQAALENNDELQHPADHRCHRKRVLVEKPSGSVPLSDVLVKLPQNENTNKPSTASLTQNLSWN